MLAVRPLIIIDPELAPVIVPVIPPGVETAVYEIIVEPPLDSGAVNDTDADVVLKAAAVPIIGAPEIVGGSVVIEFEASE